MTLKVPIWVNLNRTLTVSLDGSIWVPFGGFGDSQRWGLANDKRPIDTFKVRPQKTLEEVI